MSKPVSAKFIEIWIPRQIDHLQGRFELWKQSHAGVYRLVSIAGSARISQCIKKRFTDRTWGAANLKYFNSFIFNIPRKKKNQSEVLNHRAGM